jgi:hypothetical protein
MTSMASPRSSVAIKGRNVSHVRSYIEISKKQLPRCISIAFRLLRSKLLAMTLAELGDGAEHTPGTRAE